MKRILLVIAALIVAVSVLPADVSAAGRKSVMTSTGKVNLDALREMLTKGLKATRPDELLYIDCVVTQVEKEKIPVSHVYASFNYARKRRIDYPFPYFQYSLQALSKRRAPNR